MIIGFYDNVFDPKICRLAPQYVLFAQHLATPVAAQRAILQRPFAAIDSPPSESAAQGHAPKKALCLASESRDKAEAFQPKPRMK
jgi:hypothetical protein